jgi:hypothetical protein
LKYIYSAHKLCYLSWDTVILRKRICFSLPTGHNVCLLKSAMVLDVIVDSSFGFRCCELCFETSTPPCSVCVPVITSALHFVYICYIISCRNLFLDVLQPLHGRIMKFIPHAVVAKLRIYYVIKLFSFKVSLSLCRFWKFYCVQFFVTVAYPGIFFGGGVQQIHLRTERTGIWGQWPPSQGFWIQL